VALDEGGDGVFQGADAAVDASLDLALVRSAKNYSTWLSQEAPVGRVDMSMRPLSELAADQLGLVGRRVVHDHVAVEIARHGGLDAIQEATELGRAMARIAFADDAAGGDIESSEQGRDAMAPVIVGATPGLPKTNRWSQNL